MDICLLDYQSTSAAGLNIQNLRTAIDLQNSGLQKNNFPESELNTWIGKVSEIDHIDLGEWQSRNNALAHLGLQQGSLLQNIDDLKKRFGTSRIGVVMGSSTSSIDRTESAYRNLVDGKLTSQFLQNKVHNPHAPSLFVADKTGITGPAITINTACSSSAKVFATGARWLDAGIVDAVLVGGVDTLCLSVLHGFDSLQLLSDQPCRPLDQKRNGINLGEASGYAILVHENKSCHECKIKLKGFGESSDAHHMSHPHPNGLGAKLAMQHALEMANLSADKINYINLHGTASQANDVIEGRLIEELFPSSTQVSSTKALMGHTLGAAGITEALIAVDALVRSVIPASTNLEALDERLNISVSNQNIAQDMNYVMSNSFGFGGNNCSLIFGLGA